MEDNYDWVMDTDRLCELWRTIMTLRHVILFVINITGGCGHGWRGQVSNEEVPYHERSVQDVMIEDLQRQVAELTHRLAS
jgi:hypothetical protein